MAKININYVEIQGRVVDIMQSKGITKYKLSQIIGVDKSSITRIFNGERGWGLDMLASIAVNFKVSLDYLVFGTEPDSPKRIKQLEEKLALAENYLTKLLEEKNERHYQKSE